MMILFYVVLAVAALFACLFVYTVRTVRRVEAALPPDGRFVDVPGARLHVVERGQGPALLLVHGLSGQLGNFGYGMIEPLARDFRVVAVDRPGSGYSVRSPGARADLAGQADVLAALIDKLGLERPLVVGHSLGGAIALALAIGHPDRVGGLALLAPLTHPAEEIPLVFRPLAMRRHWVRQFVAWTLAVPMSDLRRDEVLEIVFGPDPVPVDFAMRGGGMLALRPSHFVAASEDLVAGAPSLAPLVARYAELRRPVSILFGREDRILDPAANGEAFVAKVEGATLAMVPGGHMLPLTAPGTCVDFVREAAARLRDAESATA
ncbi:alpha/beta fold hydrolase [Cupriavidus sp. WKF15]|uniref:alpha/beta fold hydrolase n=1 Tax=Cupriavidus sp. WKF15 TaxID=3032282 RepID=UPI0023E21C28|nr:alpha/beta fold hydrolase [Cupriavidus sp. WKF15]WER49212.1 alpha/beta fold hydrolase [Cupriavidus sp. WKF15]